MPLRHFPYVLITNDSAAKGTLLIVNASLACCGADELMQRGIGKGVTSPPLLGEEEIREVRLATGENRCGKTAETPGANHERPANYCNSISDRNTLSLLVCAGVILTLIWSIGANWEV